MRFDEHLKFAENQAITAAAASTNYVNFGVGSRELGAGDTNFVVVAITESFNNLTNLKIALEQDGSSGFGTKKEVAAITVALAGLTLGAMFRIPIPPGLNKQYAQVYFTPTGTAPTTGKVTAFATDEAPTNSAF